MNKYGRYGNKITIFLCKVFDLVHNVLNDLNDLNDLNEVLSFSWAFNKRANSHDDRQSPTEAARKRKRMGQYWTNNTLISKQYH